MSLESTYSPRQGRNDQRGKDHKSVTSLESEWAEKSKGKKKKATSSDHRGVCLGETLGGKTLPQESKKGRGEQTWKKWGGQTLDVQGGSDSETSERC